MIDQGRNIPETNLTKFADSECDKRTWHHSELALTRATHALKPEHTLVPTPVELTSNRITTMRTNSPEE